MKTNLLMLLFSLSITGCNSEPEPTLFFIQPPSQYFSITIMIRERDSVILPEIQDSAAVIKEMTIWMRSLHIQRDSLNKELHKFDYNYTTGHKFEL